MITLAQYFMGRDKTHKEDYSAEIESNAVSLLSKVNQLMGRIGLDSVGVNSGWRPASVNRRVGGSQRSNHITGKAIDLSDDDQYIDNWCMENQSVLKEIGLYLEHPDATPRWCHLQSVPPKSGRVVFRP